MQLDDNASWNFSTYTIGGKGKYSTENYSWMGKSLYVMTPDQDDVQYAKGLIEKIKNGETLNQDEIRESSVN